jgi:hypothetical protein
MKKLSNETRKQVIEDATRVYQLILASEGELDMEDVDYLVACAYVFGMERGVNDMEQMGKDISEGKWQEVLDKINKEIEDLEKE